MTEMDIQPYGFEKYGVIDMDLKAEDLEDQEFGQSRIGFSNVVRSIPRATSASRV